MAIQFPESAGTGPSTPHGGREPRYQLAMSLSGHLRGVTALQFSPNGETLISAGADGMVHFWDMPSGKLEHSIRAHRSGSNDLSISPDGLYIATASDDKTIQIHSTETPSSRPTRRKRLKGHTAAVLCAAFSPTSDMLVSGSFDESAIIWDCRTGLALRTLPAHAEAVWTVGWDREGGMVITGSADGLIRIWDAHHGQCLKTLDNDLNSPVSFAAFTPSSTFILSSTLSSTLRIYNIYTGKVLKTLKAPNEFISEKYPCPALLFPALPSIASDQEGDANMDNGAAGKNEAWVVSGSENGNVVIWELSSRRVAQVLAEGGHRKPVVALAVSPDGRTIATGSLEPEKIIHVWHDSS